MCVCCRLCVYLIYNVYASRRGAACKFKAVFDKTRRERGRQKAEAKQKAEEMERVREVAAAAGKAAPHKLMENHETKLP